MKALFICGLLYLFTHSVQGQTPTAEHKKMKEKIALACKLTDREQIKRMNELHQTLFGKVAKTVEHETSYEVVFQQSNDSLSVQLIEFIKFERLCCPWLNFQLIFTPNEGPIALVLGNSLETKEMVKLVMHLDK